jgi:Fe-S-cluster containining protein
VFLSEKDVLVLAKAVQMGYNDFIETYCRWVPTAFGAARLSLKETPEYDCIFWKAGCLVYQARPLQCRAFPFWKSILASSNAWKSASASCPGMGKGTLFMRDEIESWLHAQTADPVITKKI